MVAKGNVTRVEAGLTYVTCGRGFDPVTYSSPRGRINRRSRSQPERNREERKRRETQKERNTRSRHHHHRRHRDGEGHGETLVVLLAALRRAVLGGGQQEGRQEGGQRHSLLPRETRAAVCQAEDSAREKQSSSQGQPGAPGAPLQQPDGELLFSSALLRPLRLLPLPPLQHHLPLLEDEPQVPEEDVDTKNKGSQSRKMPHSTWTCIA